MRKLLLPLLLLILLPYNMVVGQELQKKTIAYVAYDYSGTYGLSYGIGFTLGKVSVVPTTRYSIGDALSTGGLSYDKSLGIEIIYWAYQTEKFRLGLVAAPIQVDWLESQDRELPEYLTQAGGLAATFLFSEKFGAIGAVKGTAQLLDADSQFKERLRFIVGFFGRI